MRRKLAVFASGNGSNLQTFIDIEKQDSDWPGEIALVVSDKPDCYAVERARTAGIDVFAVRPADYADKVAYETAILTELQRRGVEYILLAGYMRIVGQTLLGAYPERIINIHPSLLPSFPGRTAVADALAAGVTETGVTVHLVDEGIDTGPILAQEKVAIPPGVSEHELLHAVHQVEHKIYPATVRKLLLNTDKEGWRE